MEFFESMRKGERDTLRSPYHLLRIPLLSGIRRGHLAERESRFDLMGNRSVQIIPI